MAPLANETQRENEMTFEQRVRDLRQCNLSTKEAEAQAKQKGYIPESINLGKLFHDQMSREDLISAAGSFMRQRDELLEALRLLADDHEFGETGSVRQEHLAKARDAIARATS